jgi:hypothetical protein
MAASNPQILVDDFAYTTEQTRRFLPSGKTKFFTEILPQLESYLEGTRRIITGRSIRNYRDGKIAAEQSRVRPKNPHEKRRSRKSGSAP